jgi:coenzyme F420-0:L-glutamate ligase/coenzyme F420-1:gamma-L-glutamate ligase
MQPRAPISIEPIECIPEIHPGDNLSASIVRALAARPVPAFRNEPAGNRGCPVFVVAQKIVSKSEGRIVRLADVSPSAQALAWAGELHKDPRMVEVILRESRRVVRMERGILIVETRQGFVCANGGVDASNAPQGTVVLLPMDPDESARRLRAELSASLGMPLAVIISDTFGRPWRQGLTNVALGVAGLAPFIDYRGQVDSCGRRLQATLLAVADELAAAAELVMGKTAGIPVAVIQGFQSPGDGSGRDLIRPPQEDLFR